MKARLLSIMIMSAAFAVRPARADPWSIEPVLGISTDYNSNPPLYTSDIHAEEHIAGTLDLPLRYDTDDTEFLFRPSGRLTNSQGYSSLASDYAHLDTDAQFTNELGSTTLMGKLARDSSLYYVGALVDKLGVPRDTAATSADWTRSITERDALELNASWSQVRYEQPPNLIDLVSYRYLSVGPTLSIAMNERDTLKISASYGSYQALNGISASESKSLQLGLVRQLTEIWTVSASAGYSTSANSEKIYIDGLYYLGKVASTQNSTEYAATLTRYGERFNLSAGISQELTPTGYAVLSRQNGLTLNATFKHSDRWDYSLSAIWLRGINPVVSAGEAVAGSESSTRYVNTQLTAYYHLTPQWMLSWQVTRVTQQYGGATNLSAGATDVSFRVERHFLRTQF